MVAMKKIVMVDIDGVVADFNSEFLRLSRKLLAKPGKGFVVTDFDYTKCGWSDKEVSRIWNYIRHTDDFWKTLKPMSAVSSLRKHEDDYNLIFVTARTSTDGLPVAYQSQDWLQDTIGMKAPFVIADSDKAKMANELDADVAIDDRMENVLAIADARPNCRVFLIDQPYNRSLKDSRIERVDNVNEVFKRIA